MTRRDVAAPYGIQPSVIMATSEADLIQHVHEYAVGCVTLAEALTPGDVCLDEFGDVQDVIVFPAWSVLLRAEVQLVSAFEALARVDLARHRPDQPQADNLRQRVEAAWGGAR